MCGRYLRHLYGEAMKASEWISITPHSLEPRGNPFFFEDPLKRQVT